MPESQAQVRYAHDVLSGDASGDRAFAKEVVAKMHGRKMSELPRYARGSKKKRGGNSKRYERGGDNA